MEVSFSMVDLNGFSNSDLWHIICILTKHPDILNPGTKENIAGKFLMVLADREGYGPSKDKSLADFMKEYNLNEKDFLYDWI